MKYNRLLVAVMIVITLVSCMNAEANESPQESTYNGHKVAVLEAINGKTYTYLRVSENDSEHWIAIMKRDTKVGETLYYLNGGEMRDFESKELGKTFETIYFVSQISNQPNPMGEKMASAHAKSGKPESSILDISIEPAKGGITIAELYSNRDSYNGKTVIIRGKVVKFNSKIMGRNWAHIQDGTSDNNNDLTITTSEDLKVGDVVTVKGTIAVSKDFGAGYSYEVIMESASTVKTKEIQ